MAAIIAKNVIEQIRAASDIADVIGSYLQLKRAGSTLKALCPFHKEKTPSFNVNPHRQIFHCFGCGAGGDVFKFIMQYENVDFTTAVKILARRAGITVVFKENDPRAAQGKDLLYRIHDKLAEFYHRSLLEHASAAQARDYLKVRDLGEDTISAFKLGFALPGGDTLLQWARKENFTPEQLESAGLLARGDPETGRSDRYDRFRNRLMFPIRDELGRVIAFSGRVLDKEARGAKYVNSPETAIFKKGRVLYALDQARRPIAEMRTALLCEGQIDVIRCHLAGLTNAVAPLGTAVTEDHARLLHRYADGVVIVMDADPAGQNSAMRSAEILIGQGLGVQIVALPQGEDPDSLIRKNGPQALLDLVARAKSAIDFQIDTLAAREDLRSEPALRRASRAVLQTIRCAPDAVQRDHLLQRAAHRLKISPDALHADLQQLSHHRGPAASSSAPATATVTEHPPEEIELARLLAHHEECADLVRQFLPLHHLNDDACRAIVRCLLAASESAEPLVSALQSENDECQRLAASILASDSRLVGTEATPEHAAQQLILRIRSRSMERQRRDLELRRDQATGKEHERIDAELKQLILDLKALRRGWQRAVPILELDAH